MAFMHSSLLKSPQFRIDYAESICVMPRKADNVLLKKKSVFIKIRDLYWFAIPKTHWWNGAYQVDMTLYSDWLIDQHSSPTSETQGAKFWFSMHGNVACLSPSRTEVDEKRQSAFHSTKCATCTPDMSAQIFPRRTLGSHSAQCWHTKRTLFSEKIHRHSLMHSWW